MNNLLSVTSDFSYKFKLNFNYNKSSVLIVGKRVNENREWKLGNNFIRETKEYKYLGVNFDRSLSDHTHVNDVIRKGNRLIAYIKSIVNNQDDFNRVYYGNLLWKTVALPTINYACSVWVCGSNSDIKRVEGLQLQMARTIVRASRNTAKEALYSELGWDSIATIQTNHRIKYFDRLINMNDDRYPKILFQKLFSTYGKERRKTQWKWLKIIHEKLVFCGFDHVFKISQPFNTNWVQSFVNIHKDLQNKAWYEGSLSKKSLHNYCKYKHAPMMERYLLDATHFDASLLKFKIRTNTLQLEHNIKSWSDDKTGNCKLCNNNIEDANHFMFSCIALAKIRDDE